MKGIFNIGLVIALMIALVIPGMVSATWYNDSYSYRQEVSNLTGYIGYIEVPYDSNMNATFKDIIFTNNLSNQTIPYFLEFYNATTGGFKLLLNGNTSIYMYYGYADAVSQSSLSALYGTNLIGAYFLNDQSNTTNMRDYSDNLNNATLLNTPTWSVGKLGSALNFERDNSEYGVTNVNWTTPKDNFTIVLFAKYESVAAVQSMITKYFDGAMRDFSFDGGTDFYAEVSVGNSHKANRNNTYPPSDGEWHQYAMTYVSGSWLLYLDGSVRTSSNAAQTGALDSAKMPLYFGRRGIDATTQYLDADLDEILIYNDTLSATTILNYNNSANTNPLFGAEEGNIPIFAGGDGTVGSPYQIDNWVRLNATRLNITAYYILIGNLSSSTADYAGIGDDWRSFNFSGSFNGANYNISDLEYINSSINYLGLFNNLSGFVNNTHVLNLNIVGYKYVGGIASILTGMIDNSYTAGVINGTHIVGGLVGEVYGGTINNSYSLVSIRSDQSSGGLIGYCRIGKILNSYATGSIFYVDGVSTDGGRLGGLVGFSEKCNVSNSYSSGLITYDGSGFVSYGIGGLMGEIAGGTIKNSYSTSPIVSFDSSGDSFGGLIGRTRIETAGEIINCSAYGNITSITNNIGGLIGVVNNVIIYNSSSYGNISGYANVGGLIGALMTGTIYNSYTINLGEVKGTSVVGALIGYNDGNIINTSVYLSSDSIVNNTGGSSAFIGDLNSGTVVDSHMTYRNLTVGNITFLGTNPSWDGNLRDYIILRNNYASVDSNTESGLNVSAKITLGSLSTTFIDPLILRNGFSCGSLCYNLTQLNAGTVIFNVTSWTNYTISSEIIDPVISITAPLNQSNLTSTSVSFNYTLTEANPYNCWWNNKTSANHTITCGNNITYTASEGSNTLFIYANDTVGHTVFNTTTFLVDTINPGIIINTPANGSGILSPTVQVNFTASDTNIGTCWWNNGSTNHLLASCDTNITYPINDGLNIITVYVNDTFGHTNSTQVAFTYDFQFGLCNTTMTVPYLNVTFYDENTAAAQTAKITSLTAIYYTSDLNINKTYTYINLTDNPSYAFCGLPAHKQINVSLIFQYSNASYSARWYTTTTNYTNATTHLSLAMLALADSNYVTFVTYDAVYSNVVAGVVANVYTDILGVSTFVTSGTTDSSGGVVFLLNKLATYHIIYTKTGYQTYTQTVNPSLSPYSVYLTPTSAPGSGVGGGVGGGSYIPHNNLTYKTYVIPDKAWFNYNTTMVFYFNVTTPDNNTYAGSRMEEWSNSTNMLNVTMINRTGTTTTLSLAGRCGNSSDPQTLILKYYVYNNSNYSNYNLITINTYICGLDISTPGNHSLWTGIFNWGNTANINAKSQFTNGWWTFFIIALIISGLCLWLDIGNFGGTDPMVVSIGFTIVLWILSIAGNLFFIPGLGSDWIGRFVLAFISTLFMAGYIIKSMREK